MSPAYAYSAGLFRQRHRRILELAGIPPRLGWPGRQDNVLVWGQRPVSKRGRWVARQTGAGLLTVEDGFLRSVHPGVTGEAPLSLVVDDIGIYYDAHAPSRLEHLIQQTEDPGDAAAIMARLRTLGLSKYTPVRREQVAPPDPGYVLIVDQTRGDRSINGSLADSATFAQMLEAARSENPGARLLIRTHPDCQTGAKQGHFGSEDLRDGETLLDHPINPWPLIEGAERVYTVSSQLGFEALMAGTAVTCFGMPFYAGWGLTDDRVACPRRGVPRSLEHVFCAAYMQYPIYYDPYRDRLTKLETVISILDYLATEQGLDTDHERLILSGFRSWKRRHCLRFAPRHRSKPQFIENLTAAGDTASRQTAALWAWASKAPPGALPALRKAGINAALVEDGFLRSVGLGADLVEPCSLVVDDLGIYYDPSSESRLERLITQASQFPDDAPELARARRLVDRLVAAQVTKYNTGRAPEIAPPADLPIILVPGQVEDDASIRRGTGEINTNLDLLKAARAANPDATLVFKPHPDVEAGLRPGKLGREALDYADLIADNAAVPPLIDLADEIWTMTSLLGFEALLRGKPVTCCGLPFFAGWGLTRDLMECNRRTARPGIDALAWAALIAYPKYVDPVSKLPCEAELIVDRLGRKQPPRQNWRHKRLAKLQGWFAARGVIFWR